MGAFCQLFHRKQMIMIRLSIVAIFCLAVALASSQSCCERKTVGEKNYTLVESGGEVPPGCKNSCVYSQDDESSKMFCFAPGYLAVTCHGVGAENCGSCQGQNCVDESCYPPCICGSEGSCVFPPPPTETPSCDPPCPPGSTCADGICEGP